MTTPIGAVAAAELPVLLLLFGIEELGCCEEEEDPFVAVVDGDGIAGPHEVEGEEAVALCRGYVGTENANGATSDATCGAVGGEGETGDPVGGVGVVVAGGAARAEDDDGDGAAEGEEVEEDDDEKRKYDVVRFVARSIELPN